MYKVVKRTKPVKFKKSLDFKARLRYFLDNTTIHGMKYLLRKPYLMEFIWMSTLVCLLTLMGFELYISNFKYQNTKIGLSIKTNHLEWNHSFPAFTICHRERIRKSYCETKSIIYFKLFIF